MNPTRPPIPHQLAMPVKVFAWVLLGILTVPLAAAIYLVLTVAANTDANADPQASASVLSVLYLFLLGLPWVAMILIVIGLHRTMRVAYQALVVVSVLGALTLTMGIGIQLSAGRALGSQGALGVAWIGLNLIAAYLALRALHATRPLSPSAEPGAQ